VANDKEATEKFINEMTSAIQESAEASAPKHRPRADPRRPLPAGIQVEIHLKNRLRQWKITSEPALESPDQQPPKVGNLPGE
jgi:hypothetical protein